MIYLKHCLILFFIIVVTKAEYNQTLGKYFARLTVASYCVQGKIDAWSCEPCQKADALKFVHVFKNHTSDIAGYIGVSDSEDAIVLVLRGTLPWDLKTWLSEINMVKIKYPLCDNGCDVNAGFYKDWLQVVEQVRDLIKNYTATFNKKQIYVTGHSLGGALSTFAVADLISHGYKVDQYYNLGSPRVGDKKFYQWFKKIFGNNFSARITHYRDPAPHFPLQSWGFHHISTQVFYNELNTNFKICSSSGEDKECADRFDPALTDVADHLSYFAIDYATEVWMCQ